MAARMSIRWVVVVLMIAAGWAASAHGQYLYAGPGSVLQRQIRGPFIYGIPEYGRPLPVPRPNYPFLAPRTYVPAPGPYLQGPVIVPPGGIYRPNPYPPGTITPYGIPIQPYSTRPYDGYRVRPYGGYVPQPYGEPYRGYQPRASRPRFADPYAQPNWRHKQMMDRQGDAARDDAARADAPTEVQATGEAGREPKDNVKPLEGPSKPQDTATAEPNRPEGR